MFKKILEQRNRLAVFTTVILILQSILLPNGWMGKTQTAHAATTYDWPFTSGADYTLDDGLMLATYGAGGTSSALHFKIQNFDSSGLGTGLEGTLGTMSKMMYDSGGTLWGIVDGLIYSSADNGANWSGNADPVLATMQVNDIVENSYADGVGGVNLVAAGSAGVTPAIAYSYDGGTTWTTAVVTLVGVPTPTLWKALSYDTANDVLYATGEVNKKIKSTDGGANWSDITGAAPIDPVTSPMDIVTYGTDMVAIVGVTAGGTGGVDFTTDGGTTWTSATLPGAPTVILYATMADGIVYIAAHNYLAKINITGGGAMGNAGDWTNISANLAGGTFDVRSIIGGINSSIVFAAVWTGTTNALYSSIDGEQSFNLHYTDPNTTKMAGNLVFNTTGDTLLWAGMTAGGGVADVYSATVSPANTSAITQAGPGNVGTISSISATTGSLSSGDPKFSFSNANTDAGPWYYWDGAAWQSSAADDASKATTEAVLMAGGTFPADLPISGTIYVKIYTSATNSTLILDNLSITYDPQGTGSSSDVTAPSSTVNALPAYSTAPDLCDPVLTVTATATDGLGSGVASVALFTSETGDNFVTFGELDTTAPYEWAIPVQHGQTYYFYTIAVDKATPPNTESPPANPNWDTFTTIDVSPPIFHYSTPAGGDNNVSITQPVTLAFYEPIRTDTFQVEFYRTDDATKTPVGEMQLTWSSDRTAVTIDHARLEYNVQYTVNAPVAQDDAGNNWQDASQWIMCNWGKGKFFLLPLPPTFSFTTQPKMDPDLLSSHLTVADGPNADGSYNPGDSAEYTLHLINNSTYPANTATATIMFEPGMTFVEAQDIRFRTILQNGQAVGLEWNGSVPGTNDPGHIIDAKFVMKVNSPTSILTISQTGTINDGVHPDDFTMQPPAIMHIARHPDFAQSSNKGVDKSEAQLGDILLYTITIKNTGTTIADVEFSDFIPNESNITGKPPFFYKPGSVSFDADARWTEQPHRDEATQTIRGVARDVLPNSPALTIRFEAIVRGGEYDTFIVNRVYLWDPNLDFDPNSYVEASTHVPGGPLPPLRVAYQSPTPDTNNNALKQNIQIGFNSEVDLAQPFDISMTEQGEEVNIEDWLPSWREWNQIPNSMLTLFPPERGNGPEGELGVGATYEITISAGTNMDGGGLENAPVSWSFTTAEPTVQITSPADPVYEMKVNTPSDLFTVSLVDAISGNPYIAEEEVGIGLTASYMNGDLRESGSFENSAHVKLPKDIYNESKITIAKGSSTVGFYYFDTEVTDGDILKINTFEDPYKGWNDDFKYVTVVVADQPANSLTIALPKKIAVGQYGSITVGATDENGRPMTLPEGRLYLHTSGANGTFYDSKYVPLPILTADGNVTIQSAGVPQYVDIGANTNSLTLYYQSNTLGLETIIISDNNPVLPDINLNDAMAIVEVASLPPEEDLLLELEDVVDDTGRTVDHIDLTPVKAILLPGGKQEFTAVPYDAEGKVITGLKLKWFALIEKSGTIEKNGHSGSSKSTFTASAALGTYYDDVMVATLYNGKIGYATATVKIADVVNTKGPKRLPVTGMNGLQLVLLGLTLAAAVALAWVEHYDKTHFKPKSNE